MSWTDFRTANGRRLSPRAYAPPGATRAEFQFRKPPELPLTYPAYLPTCVSLPAGRRLQYVPVIELEAGWDFDQRIKVIAGVVRSGKPLADLLCLRTRNNIAYGHFHSLEDKWLRFTPVGHRNPIRFIIMQVDSMWSVSALTAAH